MNRRPPRESPVANHKVMHQAFDSLRRRFRRKRYERIRETTKIESLPGFILDLGGKPASFFAALFPRPDQVTLLDTDYALARQARRKQPALRAVAANGGRLPLADGSIDMAVCNSVIEHVDDPRALAAEIRRVSQGFFVQTPNGDFPVETHSFIAIPGHNLIPWTWLRRLVCKAFGANYAYVSSVRYVSKERLRSLFPEAAISYEKVLGLSRSFYVHSLDENPR